VNQRARPNSRTADLPTTGSTAVPARTVQEAEMAGLRVVPDADVIRQRPGGRLRQAGRSTRPEALEQAIDAAIEAAPPALLVAVRARLRDLGAEDGPEERAMFARILDLFVERSPRALARLEATLDAGDPAAVVLPARRLARQAAVLGAVPLARLCGVLADRAAAGDDVALPGTRAALRVELTVTCRVLAALGTELS
jgi:HPt (histidine-containing phosphotransfer) domain-containing protein